MIDETILHYKIIEKLGEGRMKFECIIIIMHIKLSTKKSRQSWESSFK